MNAPLVVVQGDLLLPMLYPLAGMPNAVYGEEWTLTSARPALTEFEIPFYAARFLTAYISPFSVRNDRFPYTPASLWGKFRRNDELAQSVAQSFDQNAQGIPPVSTGVTPQAVEPAPFAFEPFTAPDDRLVKAQPETRDHRKQLAGGAIALACAAFIAWALFGTKIGHQDADVQTAKVALSATPVLKPMPGSVDVAGPSTAAAAVASPAASSATVIAALPAVQKPVVASANSKPPVSTTAIASNNPPALSAAQKPAAVSENSKLASTVVIASNNRPAARNVVSERATKSRPVAHTLERDRSKTRGKSKSIASGKHDAHRYEVVHRRQGHEYQGTPVYRSKGYDAPLASPGRRVLSREDSRANTASSSLSVTDMYNMLAHSAVLDDNSGSARQAVRAAPAPSPRASSSSSSDASNWNSGMSQSRVTDTPSQFSK